MDENLIETVRDFGLIRSYDTAWKRLLSNRQILSRIMKECMHEFKDVSVKDIETKYIEGDPKIDFIPLDDVPPAIRGRNVENKTKGEGEAIFDIVYDAIAPSDNEPIRLIINVEPQGSYNQSHYPILKRAIFYCSRLISSQKDTIFVKEDYKKIRKVYSVWICTNPPVEKRNTITEYHFTEDNIHGSVKEKLVNYDLIDIIMICLDPKCEPSENYLIKLFNILKNQRLQLEEKRNIMSKEYKMDVDNNLESEVLNLGDSVGYDLYLQIREEALRDGHEAGHAEGHAEGLAEGLAEGHAEGLAEGHKAGLAEGREAGQNDKAVEIAKNMLKDNLDFDKVSAYSGLPLDQVRELALNMQ